MIRKISDGIYKASGLFVVIALGLMVILVFAQVVSRYVFKFPVAWAQELTTYLMIWMIFIGCSMGLRQGEVASLSFLVDRFPEKIAVWFTSTADFLLIIFLAVCIIFNGDIIKFAMRQTSPVLEIPMGWISLSLTVSAVLMIFYSLIHINDSLRRAYSGKKQEKAD